MSCCGPKAPHPAQQAHPTPEKNTATPKGETSGCCGGGNTHAGTQPAEAAQDAAHGDACHTHSR